MGRAQGEVELRDRRWDTSGKENVAMSSVSQISGPRDRSKVSIAPAVARLLVTSLLSRFPSLLAI